MNFLQKKIKLIIEIYILCLYQNSVKYFNLPILLTEKSLKKYKKRGITQQKRFDKKLKILDLEGHFRNVVLKFEVSRLKGLVRIIHGAERKKD